MFSWNWPPIDLHWFFEISIRTGKKFQLVYTEIFFQFSLKFFFSYKFELKKNFSQFITEFLSQFEMNAKMDISKNKWRSTGGEFGYLFLYSMNVNNNNQLRRYGVSKYSWNHLMSRSCAAAIFTIQLFKQYWILYYYKTTNIPHL